MSIRRAEFAAGQAKPAVASKGYFGGSPGRRLSISRPGGAALNDPELSSLVARAVEANPDVQMALDRLQAARTYEISMVGTVLPTAEASAAAGKGTGSDLSPRPRLQRTAFC